MVVTTFEQVKKIVGDQLGVESNAIYFSSRFIDDLGADSLDIVELIMRFEDEFGVGIPDEKVEKMRTVGDVCEYIDCNYNGTEKSQISKEQMKDIARTKGLKFKKAGN